MFIKAQRDETRPRVAAVGAGVHVGSFRRKGLRKAYNGIADVARGLYIWVAGTMFEPRQGGWERG